MSKKEYKKIISKVFNTTPDFLASNNSNNSKITKDAYSRKVVEANKHYRKKYTLNFHKYTLLFLIIINSYLLLKHASIGNFFLFNFIFFILSFAVFTFKTRKYNIGNVGSGFGYVMKVKYLKNFEFLDRILLNNMTMYYYKDDSLYSKFFFNNLNEIINSCDNNKDFKYVFNTDKGKVFENNYDMNFLYNHYINMKNNNVIINDLPFIYNKESIILLNEMNNSLKDNKLNNGKSLHLNSKLNELNNMFLNIVNNKDFNNVGKNEIKDFNIKSYEYFVEYKKV